MRQLFLIALLSMISFIYGCSDGGASTITGTTRTSDSVVASGQKISISGKLNLSDAGKLDPTSIQVKAFGIYTVPNADGTFKLEGTIPTKKVAGRVSEATTDTVRIIVGDDTLKEIPLVSWDSVLPTNYIVQRNIAVHVPARYAGNTVQAVWWDNDSIARVLTLGNGTSQSKYSGFVYSIYDNNEYVNNAYLYSIFVRVKNLSDSVVGYSSVSKVRAITGDLDYDSTQINKVYSYITYNYTQVPSDSVVTKYMSVKKKTLKIDTLYDTIEVSNFNSNANNVISAHITLDSIGRDSTDDSTFTYFYKNGIRFSSDTSMHGLVVSFSPDIKDIVDSVYFNEGVNTVTISDNVVGLYEIGIVGNWIGGFGVEDKVKNHISNLTPVKIKRTIIKHYI